MKCDLEWFFIFSFCVKGIISYEEKDWSSSQIYVFWPNATVPFYINPEHFDHYQSLTIMTTLTTFAFKTCLKFAPSLVPPKEGAHVMVFENPKGIRKCILDTDGHPRNEPHYGRSCQQLFFELKCAGAGRSPRAVSGRLPPRSLRLTQPSKSSESMPYPLERIILGYDCLKSPQIDMIIMKALGFPFEHNRSIRDNYVQVLFENIEPSAVELFTKESMMPAELQALPYDVDSVMHFGERDYSKNGHRTIMFKDYLPSPIKQRRTSLTALDLKKIEIVYGPECRKRDRQEKIELCQNYPGVARRKRGVDNVNLRVNRDISPKNSAITDLGIENEMEDALDKIFKVSAKALSTARGKYCNRTEEKTPEENSKTALSDVIESITEFAKNMIGKAIGNMTEFCQASESMEVYQRSHLDRCPFYYGKSCPQTYKSTKSGAVQWSTQHRPHLPQSTKHYGSSYDKHFAHFRANSTDDKNAEVIQEEKTGIENNNKTDNPRKSDIGDHTTVYHTKETGIEVDVVHDRKRRDAAEKDAVIVNNSKELDLKVKAMEQGSDTIDGHPSRRDSTDVPKKNLKWAARRRFHPKRSSEEQLWEDSNVSVERATSKRKPRRERFGREKSDDDERGDRHRKKRPKRPQPKSSSEGNENLARFSSVPRVVELSKNNEEFYNDRKWPDGVVRYMIKDDPDSFIEAKLHNEGAAGATCLCVATAKYGDHKVKIANYTKDDANEVRLRLEEVNAILKRKTCVQLKEVTDNEVDEDTDYLVVDTSADYVTGRVGGKQTFGCLELFQGGQHRQHAAMMVMAMLGFYFEIARHDRDKYIRVHLRHVRPDKLHHFEKIRSDATLPLPYDYDSATHPAWQFWRKLGKTGISTVATYKSQDPDGSIMKNLGQHSMLLSDTDIIKINSIYGIDCFRAARSRQIHKKKFIKNRERYF